MTPKRGHFGGQKGVKKGSNLRSTTVKMTHLGVQKGVKKGSKWAILGSKSMSGERDLGGMGKGSKRVKNESFWR